MKTSLVVGKFMAATVVIDEKGRIYLPSEIRRKLGLRKGDRLKVHVKGQAILLEVEGREVKKLRRNAPWGEEAFLDAGEALVSE